jgi:hypothetical protein
MRVVRRIYVYLVAIASLEVVIWGLVTLARTIVKESPLVGGGFVLASGLSLVLVGLPILGLHWWLAQRDAVRDEEERTSQVRAVFLYAVRLFTLIPVTYAVLAILSRLVGTLLKLDASGTIGYGQTLADNLIAIIVNGVAWYYFERVLKTDWRANLAESVLPDVRRLSRYIWVLYGLVLMLIGLQQVLSFIFFISRTAVIADNSWIGNALSFLLVGAPLWVWNWRIVVRSLEQAQERRSILRLAVLYLLSLAGIITLLSAAGVFITGILNWAFGDGTFVLDLLNEYKGSLSTALTAAFVYFYFGGVLNRELEEISDLLWRSALKRFYNYILAFLGNLTTFFGIWWLVGTVVELAFGKTTWGGGLRENLSVGLSCLVIGLPLWLRTWPKMQAEAVLQNELGDHARRSIIRKVYLYLILFMTVIGVMVTAGMLLYLVFNNVLGIESDPNFWLDFVQRLQSLGLIGLWLVYHLWMLIQDGRVIQQALKTRHTAFPALILQTGEDAFGNEVVLALRRIAPDVPVTVRKLETEPLDESLEAARVIVLPADLALNPPEALRLWLQGFSGQKVVVPFSASNWTWLGLGNKSVYDMAKETALAIRQLAEGQTPKPLAQANTWTVLGYVFGALFALQLLFFLITFGISLFVD